MAAPGALGGVLLGDEAKVHGVRIVLRHYGARDVVLGLGTLWAVAGERDVGAWLVAGIASDVLDTAVQLGEWSYLPPGKRLPNVLMALGAAGAGVALRPAANEGLAGISWVLSGITASAAASSIPVAVLPPYSFACRLTIPQLPASSWYSTATNLVPLGRSTVAATSSPGSSLASVSLPTASPSRGAVDRLARSQDAVALGLAAQVVVAGRLPGQLGLVAVALGLQVSRPRPAGGCRCRGRRSTTRRGVRSTTRRCRRRPAGPCSRRTRSPRGSAWQRPGCRRCRRRRSRARRRSSRR